MKKRSFSFLMILCFCVAFTLDAEDKEEILKARAEDEEKIRVATIDEVSPEVIDQYQANMEESAQQQKEEDKKLSQQASLRYSKYVRGEGVKVDPKSIDGPNVEAISTQGQATKYGQKYSSNQQRSTTNNARKYERGEGRKVSVNRQMRPI